MSSSIANALPKPQYTGDHEELPLHSQTRGPRIVDASSLDNQIVLKRKGPPTYGQRSGWRPRNAEDFGDGGAFPEIPIAQYPCGMGRKSTSASNALAIQVDQSGNVKYDALARRGHADSRIIHSSFKDLIPLRERANVGEISLERPSEEEVQATKEKTQAALAALVSGAVSAQNPKNVKGKSKDQPTYVRYTPSSGQMGDHSKKNERIIKIVQRQQDPLEPPKFKHKKIPGRAPSPPPPVMHSPPRKLTAEDQEAWKIPPSISNWKNPKGFTIALDKRLASDGRGMQDVTINHKFAEQAEALAIAERKAREEVKDRALMQHKLAEKEKQAREDKLRDLAQKARNDRAGLSQRKRSRSGSRSESSYGSESEAEAENERAKDRRDRAVERQRELRMSKMGAEKRMKALARDQGRDISEKVALGLAKPTTSAESAYDSRLFNQSSGFASGFNEDQAYDKPLFAAQEGLNSIYRTNVQDEDPEDADATLDRLSRTKRFNGFKDAASAEAREGPVQFEKDKVIVGSVPGKEEDDPFNIGQMISDVTNPSTKRFGIQDGGRETKRARVDSDED